MRTGWGTVACGIVVGAAAGFVCGHVAAWTQASAHRDDPSVAAAWPALTNQLAMPSLPDMSADADGPVFFPQHLHASTELAEPVHADAELAGGEPTQPAALPEAAAATPISEESQETLRAILDAELSHLPPADRDVWLDVLAGLPPADAVGIVRLWKRFGSGPAVGELDPAQALPDLFTPSELAPTPVTSAPGTHPQPALEARLMEARGLVLHNLQNLATVGYRRVEPIFSTGSPHIAANVVTPALPARMIASRIDQAAGGVIETASPLDVAIDGEGFFVVKQPTGRTFYTRCGRFSRDPEGRLALTTSRGELPVEPELKVPGDCTALLVASNGDVSIQREAGEREQLGVLALALFVAPAQLNATDDALFVPSAGSGEPQIGKAGTGQRGTLLQHHLERSNVDAASETALLRQIDEWVQMASEAATSR